MFRSDQWHLDGSFSVWADKAEKNLSLPHMAKHRRSFNRAGEDFFKRKGIKADSRASMIMHQYFAFCSRGNRNGNCTIISQEDASGMFGIFFIKSLENSWQSAKILPVSQKGWFGFY